MYAGLPLAFALWRAGAQVHLASLSFSELELIDRDAWVAERVAALRPDTTSPDWHFPERTLARWLAAQSVFGMCVGRACRTVGAIGRTR
ncbi:hypothetical protein AB0K35_23415 [Micromonospora sp. NPDC053740]|uniref:hypothetical protein n=1 Tax=Micromonospora sp. NPDC053740 TaxID=3155173 RepID=UPI0034149D89